MFLTLDVGTTAVKAGLFDEKLNLLHIQIEEYELLCREGEEWSKVQKPTGKRQSRLFAIC